MLRDCSIFFPTRITSSSPPLKEIRPRISVAIEPWGTCYEYQALIPNDESWHSIYCQVVEESSYFSWAWRILQNLSLFCVLGLVFESNKEENKIEIEIENIIKYKQSKEQGYDPPSSIERGARVSVGYDTPKEKWRVCSDTTHRTCSDMTHRTSLDITHQTRKTLPNDSPKILLIQAYPKHIQNLQFIEY